MLRKLASKEYTYILCTCKHRRTLHDEVRCGMWKGNGIDCLVLLWHVSSHWTFQIWSSSIDTSTAHCSKFWIKAKLWRIQLHLFVERRTDYDCLLYSCPWYNWQVLLSVHMDGEHLQRTCSFSNSGIVFLSVAPWIRSEKWGEAPPRSWSLKGR